MIQFNLLPDIKTEYIKGRRLKRLLILAAVFAAALSVAMVILTFSMTALQKKHITDLNKDINKYKNEINSVEDLNKILSVQKQLDTLPELFEGRPAVERLPGYLDQVTPVEDETGISNLEIDFVGNTMVIDGTSNSLATINKFADALKFTTYSYKEEGADEATTEKAFNDVVLDNFSRNQQSAGFSITMTFDPLIFDETKVVKLNVPSQVTTRSQLKDSLPALFNGLGEEE